MISVPQNSVDLALDRQKKAWLEGSRPSVDDLLRDSSLPSDTEVLLDLIYNEIVIREELGETPTLDEYAQRYPNLVDDLRLHLEVHRAIQDDLLIDTNPVRDTSETDHGEDPSESGPILADYEIIGELGHGGMGVVYKARHRGLKRHVALKMFQPGRHPSPRELARFRMEAETVARLQHSNIVQIFEVGQAQGLPFLALELATKGTLQQKLQNFSFEPRAAAALVETLARAIQHAHEHSVIHRDLKPANVLFAADDTPKITDFGLAKLLETDLDDPRDITRSGEPVGTPRYMSPEQASGKADQIGPATDIYALGTILYECLTGQAPFVSSSVVETVDRIRHEQPLAPRRLQRSIPRDLETICLNCLHKQPSRRYASAEGLADDLRRFLRGEPILARRTPRWERVWMWCRRRPAWATLIAVGAISALVAVALWGFRHHQEQQRLATLRIEVGALVKEGQQALSHGDGRQAKDRLEVALAKVQAEPRLRDFELGIRGWLDHSIRETEQQRWNLRKQPPAFEERRNDTFVQVQLADAHQAPSVQSARRAIANALEFAVGNDPAWRLERESLLLLEADLALRADGAAAALAVLDTGKECSTRLAHLRRAEYLGSLGKASEAARERTIAAGLAPRVALEAFFAGLDHLQNKRMDTAVREFDRALASEPEHFLARYFQAAAFLQLHKPSEAKVGLTACVAQHPRFPWTYIQRGQAYLQLGDLVAAAQDFQHAHERLPNPSAQRALDDALRVLDADLAALSLERQDAFWNEKIHTAEGPRPLGTTAIFHRNRKNEPLPQN